MLFIADAVISIIAALIVVFSIPETKPEAVPGSPEQTMTGSFRGYLTVLQDRIFMLFISVCVLVILVYMNINTTLGVYLRDTHAVPESGYGLLLSLNAIMVVFFQFPITRRIQPYPPMLMLALGTFLYAVGFTMYGFTTAYIMFLLAMVIITIGEMLVVPVSQSLVAHFAPQDMRGRYMAVFGFSWGIPFAVGPLLAGLIMDQYDQRWLWYACGLIGMLAVLGFLWLGKKVPAVSLPATQPAPE
jgi:MFS family permease